MHPATLEIGRITKKTALASNSTRMATSMKAYGKETSAMDKVPTGAMKAVNSEGSTLATGKMIPNKAEVPCFTNWGTDMTECGWTIYLTAKAE